MATGDTLQTLFGRLAARGDAPAIIAFVGEEQHVTSFAALAAAAETLAHDLIARGVGGPGARIAILAPGSAHWITAFWAIVATGAAAVPLDALLSDGDAASLVEKAGCRLAFTTEARASHLPCPAIVLDRLPLAMPAASSLFAAPKPGDVAVLLFTSGTTGTPKPVPLTHANLLSNIEALAGERIASAGDRALLPLPLHHAYSLTVGMLTGLTCGAALVLPSGVSGPEMLSALRNGKVSVLLGVPRLYEAFMSGIRQRMKAQRFPLAQIARAFLALSSWLQPIFGTGAGRVLFGTLHRQFGPSLRLFVSGGARLDEETERMLATLGWEVLSGYGLTETSPILTFNRPGRARVGTAGQALPGVELRLVNVDADGTGEIEARGASVFTGYEGEPEATARAFTADGWFRTSDFGRIDQDGYLTIVARVSETIVLADGKKLYPEPVEAVYAEHRLIKEIALFARQGALVALVVPDLDAFRETGAVRMREFIRDALSDQGRTLPSHARPSGFAVARDKLPRTQLGKLRRHLVKELYEQALSGHQDAAPVELNADDKALLAEPVPAEVWRFLAERFAPRTVALDMSPQLDLGVDSLAWVDLTLALERACGVRLTEQEIGRIVTVRDLLREARDSKGRVGTAPEAPPPALPHLNAAHLLLRHALTALMRAVMRRWYHLTVEGQENLPPHGPVLICPNHESYLDPFAVAAALPAGLFAETWWGGWTGMLFTTPLRRLFSRVAQIVPVDQSRGGSGSLALGAQVFARDGALVWFPEGGLTRTGEMQAFLPGVGVLLDRHRVPVVPVAIEGSYEAWPWGGRRKRHPIRVRFGAPIAPDTLLAAGVPQAVANRLREAVVELAAE